MQDAATHPGTFIGLVGKWSDVHAIRTFDGGDTAATTADRRVRVSRDIPFQGPIQMADARSHDITDRLRLPTRDHTLGDRRVNCR